MFWSPAKYVHGLSSLVVCLFLSLSSLIHIVLISFSFLFFSFCLSFFDSVFRLFFVFVLSSSSLTHVDFLPLFVCLFLPFLLHLSYNDFVNSNDRWLYQALPACLVFILLFLPSSDALHNYVTPRSKILYYFNARRLTLKAPHIISVSCSTVLTHSLVNCCGIGNQKRRYSRIYMRVELTVSVNSESIRFWNVFVGVIGVATKLRARRSEVRIPVGVWDFYFLHNFIRLTLSLPSLLWHRGYFPGTKRSVARSYLFLVLKSRLRVSGPVFITHSMLSWCG